MSCLGPNYLPTPSHIWSRVQNNCSTNSQTTDSTTVYVPLTKKTIPLLQYNYENKINMKGNILQYKVNSSHLTKKQQYAQIIRGKWTNRTKTWATQTETYTNPNINSLKRINNSNISKLSTLKKYTFDCSTNIIEDGGTLLCNQTVSPCSGITTKITYTSNCSLSTASNVPGPEIVLCWNSKLQTYYPRQRYIMSSIGNKFPTNYKLLVSANSLGLQNI